jgi:hypothetical protein
MPSTTQDRDGSLEAGYVISTTRHVVIFYMSRGSLGTQTSFKHPDPPGSFRKYPTYRQTPWSRQEFHSTTRSMGSETEPSANRGGAEGDYTYLAME